MHSLKIVRVTHKTEKMPLDSGGFKGGRREAAAPPY